MKIAVKIVYKYISYLILNCKGISFIDVYVNSFGKLFRSPEMPPPPLYNDDDNSKETFQSCTVSAALDILEVFSV